MGLDQTRDKPRQQEFISTNQDIDHNQNNDFSLTRQHWRNDREREASHDG